jgi:hypothetical protein
MKYFLVILGASINLFGCNSFTQSNKNHLVYRYKNWIVDYKVVSNLHTISFFTRNKDTVGYFVAGATNMFISHDKSFSPVSTLKFNHILYQYVNRQTGDSIYFWRGEVTKLDRPVVNIPGNCRAVLNFIDSISLIQCPGYTSQIQFLNKLFPITFFD